MTILNQVSLGHYYFDIGLVMRDTILISKLVFNSEVWYNVTDKQISKLEQIDHMFLRKLLNLSRSAPREGMYMECGKLPVRFVIKTRRLMFFWHDMNKEKHEILYKFLSAQTLSSSRGDWIRQVRRDLAEIKLDLSDSEVENMPKETFKKLVKQKIETCAVKYLIEIKNAHSKTSKIEFSKFQTAEYMKSNKLNKEEVETMKNIIDFKSIHYDMLFSNTENQIKIAKIYTVILKTRLDLKRLENK